MLQHSLGKYASQQLSVTGMWYWQTCGCHLYSQRTDVGCWQSSIQVDPHTYIPPCPENTCGRHETQAAFVKDQGPVVKRKVLTHNNRCGHRKTHILHRDTWGRHALGLCQSWCLRHTITRCPWIGCDKAGTVWQETTTFPIIPAGLVMMEMRTNTLVRPLPQTKWWTYLPSQCYLLPLGDFSLAVFPGFLPQTTVCLLQYRLVCLF